MTKFSLEDVEFPEEIVVNRKNVLVFTERRIALIDASKKRLDIVDLGIIKRVRVGWSEDTGALSLAKISGIATIILLMLINIKEEPLYGIWVLPALSAIVFLYYLLKWLGSRGATLEFLREYGEEAVLKLPVSSYESATALINDFLKAKDVQETKHEQKD